MKAKQWLRVTLLGAATAALPTVRSFAQPADNPDNLARQEYDQLRATLYNPGKAPRERDEAAKRLLQRGATDALLQALRSGNIDLQVPVARALSELENPPLLFLDDLLLCLQPRTSVELANAASRAAVGYRDNPAARERLRSFILSANVPERVRVPAVLALGTLNDKDTAQFLVQTVLKGDDPRITPLLSDTAADALAEMTGLNEYGRDQGQWDRWWQAQQNKPPEQFLAERRAERELTARTDRERLKVLASEIDKLAEDLHRPITNDQERAAYVIKFLDKPAAEFRAAGARLVNIELSANLSIAPEVMQRLRELIGDSSPDVRRRVAGAIAAINDPLASKPLLAQLQRERLPDVKAAIIQALAPIKDVGAWQEFIHQLDDPAFVVAEAAAKALADLGPEIAKNRNLTNEVSTALSKCLQRTTGVRGANRLRENVVEAMTPLRDPGLVKNSLFPLLVDREGNTPNVRRAAIRALAAMKGTGLQTDIAGQLAGSLRDLDKSVRLEAAIALGNVGGPAQANALFDAMSPRETDPAVREAAWKSLSSLFDQFELTSLVHWSETFRGLPERQLVVDLARYKKLKAGAAQPDELAVVQEEIGTLYLSPVIDKPAEAIPYLDGALKHWDGKGPGIKTATIQDSLVDAYLRSRLYKEAVAFAGQRIARKETNQEPMGRAILREVDRLSRANQYQPALDLLTEAKNLPIQGQFKELFEQRDRDIKSRNPARFDWYTDWSGVYA